MSDSTLESQMNETRKSFPGRIKELFSRNRGNEDKEPLSAETDPSSGGEKSSPGHNRNGPKPYDPFEQQRKLHLRDKVSRTTDTVGNGVAKNIDQHFDHVDAAHEVMGITANETASAAASVIMGFRSGLTSALKEARASTDKTDIQPSDPQAIHDFIATLPPPHQPLPAPPKQIAAPLKRLPPPNRYNGNERD